MQRKKFIQSLFSWLEGKDYLWLKAILDLPEETPETSDIDLYIPKKDLKETIAFIQSQELVLDTRMQHQGVIVFMELTFFDGSQLKVDLLTKLFRKQWTYLPETYLMENSVIRNGIRTYHSKVLFEHVILFNYLNNSGIPLKYFAYFQDMDKTSQLEHLSFINEKYGLQVQSFEAFTQFSDDIKGQLIAYLKQTKYNNSISRFRTALGYLKQKLSNIRLNTGKIVTFSGVDGAGKTTLLNDLKQVLSEKCQQKVIVLRHRPSLLPILSALTQGKKAAESKAANTLPRQGTNRSLFSSLLRFSYYYVDYLFGQIYIWFRYLLPGYTIIYDRYYFDFIVDGKRSNIALGEGFPKWLYRFIVKPSLNVFLYADPAVIRQRKQELPASDIALMTGRYKALFSEFSNHYNGQYLCIENIDRRTSLHTILKHLLKTQ